MNITSTKWIWQQADWPKFHWQDDVIQPLLRAVRLKQGVLLGKTGAAGGHMPFLVCHSSSL